MTTVDDILFGTMSNFADKVADNKILEVWIRCDYIYPFNIIKIARQAQAQHPENKYTIGYYFWVVLDGDKGLFIMIGTHDAEVQIKNRIAFVQNNYEHSDIRSVDLTPWRQ